MELVNIFQVHGNVFSKATAEATDSLLFFLATPRIVIS